MTKTDTFINFTRGICAGICIALGCVVNLTVGGTLGSVLFSFGLMSVILWKFPLFTGVMGYTYNWREFGLMIVSLIGNIVGCTILGLTVSYCNVDIAALAEGVVRTHMSYDWLKILLLSGWCGFIMTTVVKLGRMQPRRQMVPLIFGVSLFILCGFIHSIADAGYIFLMQFDNLKNMMGGILPFYGLVVLGNYIGGNLTRFITWDWEYKYD